MRKGTMDWTGPSALTRVERLEAACHRVMLPAGDLEAREALREMLPLDLGHGLDPNSPAASAARAAADQTSALTAVLDERNSDPLKLRVDAARLCQTLASMRGHLSGGRRLGGRVGIGCSMMSLQDSNVRVEIALLQMLGRRSREKSARDRLARLRSQHPGAASRPIPSDQSTEGECNEAHALG